MPTRTDVNQVVVTGPGAPPIATVDDLSGHEVFVRKISIYDESIAALNEQLKARGRPPVEIIQAPDVLEDDDVLEMVNAGLAPITIVDDYLADFWSRCSPISRCTATSRCAPAVCWPWRFARTIPSCASRSTPGCGSTARATASATCSNAATSRTSSYARTRRRRPSAGSFRRSIELFKKYGAQYDVDYLLMAAQGYQESTLDQNVKSPVGAIGVMQVMPPTGKELNVGDITEIDANIHAGVKYMRFMVDQLLQGRADGQPEQGADDVRVVQRRPWARAAVGAETAKSEASIRTSGSATSSASPRSGSGARP